MDVEVAGDDEFVRFGCSDGNERIEVFNKH